jgi:hypothetical protein
MRFIRLFFHIPIHKDEGLVCYKWLQAIQQMSEKSDFAFVMSDS